MKLFTLRYPGDPPARVQEMNRSEFLAEYRPSDRPHGVTVTSYGPEGVDTEFFPVPAGCVVCDLCNEDPGDDITVVEGSRAYCRACRTESLEKHLTPVRNG